jgi:hypothetical protein
LAKTAGGVFSGAGIAVDADLVIAGRSLAVSVAVFLGLSATSVGATGASVVAGPEWLGSRSAGAAQSGVAVIRPPSQFEPANLLVALVAADGPDSIPVGTATSETSVRISDRTHLRWTRAVHVSARHDVGLHLETFGASAAEIWTARPPAGWVATDDVIQVVNTHPTAKDDGFVVTIAAFANGRLAETGTVDGMDGDAEQLAMAVPDGSAIYAATFAGHRNADFTPNAGMHRVAQRRAGDDTAGVIASDSRALPASVQDVGYTAPTPGNFWEMAVAVISPASPA